MSTNTSYLESAAGMWDLIGADSSNSWQADGACAAPDVDPDLHFPLTDGKPRPFTGAVEAQIAEAKRVCATCPVIKECRAYGFTQRYGVWGGLDEDERRVIKRETNTLTSIERKAIKARAASPGNRKTPVTELAKGA